MNSLANRLVRWSAGVACLALLLGTAQAANPGANKKKANDKNCDHVTAVDTAQSTVTVYDHLKQEEVTYKVTADTEIFLLHAKVGLAKLMPGTKVTVTAGADPQVAVRIDGVDVPPRQPKAKANVNKNKNKAPAPK